VNERSEPNTSPKRIVLTGTASQTEIWSPIDTLNVVEFLALIDTLSNLKDGETTWEAVHKVVVVLLT
jgi:RNase P/RNase MRP subunit p30